MTSVSPQARWRWTTCPSRTWPWWPPTKWQCCSPSTTARRWPTRSCRTARRWTRRSCRRPSSPCWTSRCSTTTRRRSEPAVALCGVWLAGTSLLKSDEVILGIVQLFFLINIVIIVNLPTAIISIVLWVGTFPLIIHACGFKIVSLEDPPQNASNIHLTRVGFLVDSRWYNSSEMKFEFWS